MYLKLLVHLLHHVNFDVMAAVYLAQIVRKNLPNTHMSIISNVKLGPVAFQKLLLGGTFGQYGWPPQLNIAGLGDLDIRVLRIIRPD